MRDHQAELVKAYSKPMEAEEDGPVLHGLHALKDRTDLRQPSQRGARP